jgi:hypothetical protein
MAEHTDKAIDELTIPYKSKLSLKTIFITVTIVMCCIWASIFFLIVRYGEQLQNHPCAICANKTGKTLMCIPVDGKLGRQYFYTNYSSEIESPLVKFTDLEAINLTLLQNVTSSQTINTKEDT